MDEVRGGSSERALWVAEGLIAAALLFAPLALGAVQWWSLGIVALLSTGAALAASVARPMRVAWPVWAAFAITAFVGFQAIPLPPSLLRVLSPNAAETIELATGTLGWHALSLDPAATARELLRLFAYSAAFFATARVVADNSGATRRLSRIIAVGMLAECAVAVAQKAVDTHAIYGVVAVTMPNNAILGTFGNPNHLAAYLTLGIPMLAMVAMRTTETAARRLCWIAVCGASCLVVLTLSRSGMIGLAAATVMLLLLTRGGDRNEPATPISWQRVGIALGGVALLFIVVVRWIEPRRSEKLAVLFHPSRLLDEEKVQVWRDLPSLVRDHLGFGIGRGAFEEVFPAYKNHADWMTFSHVECGPLQALVDLGLFAGVALMVLWGIGLLRAARRDGMMFRMGAVAALVGVTVHDFADFSLEGVGAVGLTAAVLWGLAVPAIRTRRANRAPALVLVAGAIAAAFAFGYARRGDLRRDIATVEEAAKDPRRDLEPLVRPAIARHPAEPWLSYMAGLNAIRQRRPGPALHYLGRAIARDPKGWRYHEAIGIGLWQLGRASQSRLEFRGAYVGANYFDGVIDTLLVQTGATATRDLPLLAGEDAAVAEQLAGYAERRLHDPPLVLLLARRCLEIDPTRAEPRRILARALVRDKKWDDVLRETAALSDPEATLLRVAALEGLGREAEGDALLDRALALSPTAELAFARADRALRRHSGGVLAILQQIDEGKLRAPEIGHLHRLRAAAFSESGRPADQIAELIIAARIDPTDVNRLDLGEAYERSGKLRAAILTYRDLARTSDEAKARLARLGALRGDTQPLTGGGGAGLLAPLDDTPPDPGAEGATEP